MRPIMMTTTLLFENDCLFVGLYLLLCVFAFVVVVVVVAHH